MRVSNRACLPAPGDGRSQLRHRSRLANEYNEDFHIIRESGCIHFEKPFLYLIFGQNEALLEDMGAGEVQTASYIMSLLAKLFRFTKDDASYRPIRITFPPTQGTLRAHPTEGFGPRSQT